MTIFLFEILKSIYGSILLKDHTKKIISGKDRKELINSISEYIQNADDLLPKKSTVTRYIFSKRESIYALGKNIVLIETKGHLIPHIKIVRKLQHSIPIIKVDTGAIKFVVNGADVMRPGVVEIDDTVIEGSLVLVIENTKGGALCFGQAMYDAVDMKVMEKGKCIKNLHHLKDEYWELE